MKNVMLNTTCFSIQNRKVVEGKLSDFVRFIESTTRPDGVGYKYYTTQLQSDKWALVMWATWGGPEVVVREFGTKEEADKVAEESYVADILSNSEIAVYLKRTEAEFDLAEILGESL